VGLWPLYAIFAGSGRLQCDAQRLKCAALCLSTLEYLSSPSWVRVRVRVRVRARVRVRVRERLKTAALCLSTLEYLSSPVHKGGIDF
jgi:hypothetical protein